MHGVVFMAIEAHLRERREYGVLSACFPTPGAYLAISDYPDDELVRIAQRIAGRRSSLSARPLDDVLRNLGEAIPATVQRIAPLSIPKAIGFSDLLVQIERSPSHARGILPPLTMRRRDDGLASLVYAGDPRVCRFVEGLLVGLAALLGEPVAFRHPTCKARGDAECVFVARFLRQETSSPALTPRRPAR